MIWTSTVVDQAFLDAFLDAGPLNEEAVMRHLAQKKRHHPVTRQGVARYYYLLGEDPSVKLTCMAMPLADWQGGAMVIIGSYEIIGEFEGNRELVGLTGIQLKMQPLAWLRKPADRQFSTASSMLAQVSEQTRTRQRVDQVQ